MRIQTIVLLAIASVALAACSPGPGSEEWCKGVIKGEIQASQAELEANSQKCEAVLMKEVMGSLGGQ